jgi:mRNA interferase YafQ
MRQPDYSGQFKRDIKQAQKRGKNMTKLKVLIGLIINDSPLPPSYLDHPQKATGVAAAMRILNQIGY